MTEKIAYIPSKELSQLVESKDKSDLGPLRKVYGVKVINHIIKKIKYHDIKIEDKGVIRYKNPPLWFKILESFGIKTISEDQLKLLSDKDRAKILNNFHRFEFVNKISD